MEEFIRENLTYLSNYSNTSLDNNNEEDIVKLAMPFMMYKIGKLSF